MLRIEWEIKYNVKIGSMKQKFNGSSFYSYEDEAQITQKYSLHWRMAICVDLQCLAVRTQRPGIEAATRGWKELHRVLVLDHIADVAPHDVPDAD